MYVHSSRIQKQFEYLKAAGIDCAEAYSLAGIAKGEELDPDKAFGFDQYIKVLEFALEKTGDSNYGLNFGSRPELGGTIGIMSASCRNLKEAFVTGCQVLKVQGNFAELSFVDDKVFPKLVYELDKTWPLESPVTAKVEVDAMFAFLSTILSYNSNNNLRPYSVKLSYPRPDNTDIYTDKFGKEPVFDSGENAMVFYARDLLIPMKAFNPETFNLLKSYLEGQLRKMENKESLSEKVRRIILSYYQYHFPDIETVASKLNLSARTLQRYLSSEETSFKNILQDAKMDIARQLLKEDHLTISEIGYMLGYSDIGNFSRSFKKNTGMSPGEFRQGGNES